MIILPSLKYLNTHHQAISETIEEIQLYSEMNTKMFSDFIIWMHELKTQSSITRVELSATLGMSGMNDILEVVFSPSMDTIQVDELSGDAEEIIDKNQNLPTFKQLKRTQIEKEVCSPMEFVSLIRGDRKELEQKTFYWTISASIPKEPFVEQMKSLHFTKEAKPNIVIFLSTEGLIQVMRSEYHRELYEIGLSNPQGLILAVGGFNSEVTGKYLHIRDLWDSSQSYSDILKQMKQEKSLQKQHEELKAIASSGVIDYLIAPDFFDISTEEPDHIKRVLDTFNEIKIFYIMLTLASYAFKDNDSWRIRFIGAKEIEGKIKYDGDGFWIDNQIIELESSSLIEFYYWIFTDSARARIILARKSIALHASKLMDLIKQTQSITKFVKAAFNQYLDKAVSEVLEINQRFTEYSLDWTGKNIDLNLKLQGIVNDTALGGLSSIIGVIIGLTAQQFDPTISGILLIIVPIVFIIYLGILLLKLSNLESAHQDYIGHHEKQINYYTRILGQEIVQEVSGEKKPEDIRKIFKNHVRNYQTAIAVVAFISLIMWFVLLFVGNIFPQ